MRRSSPSIAGRRSLIFWMLMLLAPGLSLAIGVKAARKALGEAPIAESPGSEEPDASAASARPLVDNPCIQNPTFPPDCVSQLGSIGGASTTSPAEGFLNIATPVVDPLLLLDSKGKSGGLLYVLNPMANMVRVLNPARDLRFVRDIPVCYRPSALAQSADGRQVFVSCHGSHAVGIIDTDRNLLVAEIEDRDADGRPRLQEPMGMAVLDDTLYVASSQNNRVAVVDLKTRRVARYIEIPGQDPRDLAITPDGRFLLVANFLAGNRSEAFVSFNTSGWQNPATPAGSVCAPLLANPTADNVAFEGSPTFMDTSHPQYATIAECYLFAHTFASATSVTINPARVDHDVVVVRLDDGRVTFTSFGLVPDIGTLNYGLAIDPSGSKVYLATVHSRNFLNASFGKRPLINGLSILDLDPETGDLAINTLQDLDQPFLDAQGNGSAVAATPYAVVRSGDGVLIAAAGSDSLVMANADGEITGTIPVGFTPKGVVAAEDAAYVYNATGLSVSKVDLVSRQQVLTASIGPIPLSQSERIGAHLFNSSKFASNRTFACASCHPDGHIDGLVWKLNAQDGLRATQSIQDISETAPYHWDGSKCNLVKILQDGINNLFGNPAGPTSCEMKTMIDWMDGLVRPHTPFRAADDRMSDPAKLGLLISQRGFFKDGSDAARPCTGRPQDPAVEAKYLAMIGDSHNSTFRFGGAGGPVPNTTTTELCGSANCHVSPRWESKGFLDGNPNGPLSDGFQAVSTIGIWDRMIAMHDGRMTRTWFKEALRINRAYHGAPAVDSGLHDTGELATHGFNDSFFRHPEFNFDASAATHAFALTDALTSFSMEEEIGPTGAVGLSAVLTRSSVPDEAADKRIAILQSSAEQGKILWRGTGTIGGVQATLTWQPGLSAFLRDDGTSLSLALLKSSLVSGDSVLLYGALKPGQESVSRPKLKSVMRATSPILCSEGYADYHANVLAGDRGAVLVLHTIDAPPGSRVLIDGQVTGAPLSGAEGFTWTLPQAPKSPTTLAVQILSPTGIQSNSVPLLVVAPVVPAHEPERATIVKAPGAPGTAALRWESQFGITGPGTVYDVFGGSVTELRASGFASGACLTPVSTWDAQISIIPRPAVGDARYYLVRAQNQAGVSTWGSAERDAGIAASSSPCSTLFPGAATPVAGESTARRPATSRTSPGLPVSSSVPAAPSVERRRGSRGH